MKPHLIAATALIVGQVVAAPVLAQDSGTTSSVPAAGQNAADYLTPENLQDFYTDPNLKTMKAAEEVKREFDTKSLDDQAKLQAACAANEESRFADLCKAIPSV